MYGWGIQPKIYWNKYSIVFETLNIMDFKLEDTVEEFSVRSVTGWSMNADISHVELKEKSNLTQTIKQPAVFTI